MKRTVILLALSVLRFADAHYEEENQVSVIDAIQPPSGKSSDLKENPEQDWTRYLRQDGEQQRALSARSLGNNVEENPDQDWTRYLRQDGEQQRALSARSLGNNPRYEVGPRALCEGDQMKRSDKKDKIQGKATKGVPAKDKAVEKQPAKNEEKPAKNEEKRPAKNKEKLPAKNKGKRPAQDADK